MGKIVNRTQEFYPDVENAEFLHYQDDALPEGLIISKNNVVTTQAKNLVIKNRPAYWGWNYRGNFHHNFNTPEEAIAHFKDQFSK